MKEPRRSDYETDEEYQEAWEEYDYWCDTQYELRKEREEEERQ